MEKYKFCSIKTYDKQYLRTKKPSNALINLYLAYMVDIETSFMEPLSAGFSSTILLALENAGCLGSGNCASLVSIDITSDIIGLSTALSSTHSKPTWMHLKTWSLEQDSLSIGSTISNGLPAFHSSHAWIKFTFNVKIKLMQLEMLSFMRLHEMNLHIPQDWEGGRLFQGGFGSFYHSQFPAVKLQNWRHQISQRRCPPWHTQGTYNHCMDKVNVMSFLSTSQSNDT